MTTPSSTPVVVRARSRRELLDLVPRIAEFDLTESLLCLVFESNRSSGGFRLDLPPLGREQEFAHAVTRLASRYPRRHHLLLVITTAEGSVAAAPQQRVAVALRCALDRAGFELIDVLWQSATAWGSYVDGVAQLHSQPQPQPQACSAGSEPGSERERERAAPSATERTRFALLVRAAETPRANRALLDVLERTLCGHGSALDRATVIRAIEQPALRDLVLIQWAFGAAAGQQLVAEIRRHGRHSFDSPLAARVLGQGADCPDLARLALARERCAELRALAPREWHPTIYIVEAWMLWASGQTTRATKLLGCALELNPEHTFAALFLAFLNCGQVPNWAFASRAPELNSTSQSTPAEFGCRVQVLANGRGAQERPGTEGGDGDRDECCDAEPPELERRQDARYRRQDDEERD